MIRCLTVDLLVRETLRPRERGRLFLQTLQEAAPSYAPEFYNNVEPVNRRFDSNASEQALSLWGWVWFWARRKPRVSGTVTVGNGTHSSIFLTVSPTAFDLSAVKSLFSAMDEAFGLDLAYIHPEAKADLVDLEYYRTHIMPFRMGPSTHRLVRGLPDLTWAMYFGDPYRALFGERLLDAPAFAVESLHNGVFLQLTKDYRDAERQRAAFERVREACKIHLGMDAFADVRGDAARVPEFALLDPA